MQFDLVTALVRAQERAVKRLKYRETEAFDMLSLIAEKYLWIKDPIAAFEEEDEEEEISEDEFDTFPVHTEAQPRSARKGSRPHSRQLRVPSAERPIRPAAAPFGEQPVGQSTGMFPVSPQPPDGAVALEPCPFCERRFNPERLPKHQRVCDKNPEIVRRRARRGRLDMTQVRLAGLQPE
eukprot:gnl/Chilomastix_cuspidata/3642.p2 GENE.gnl/Chilomastix_cuspidata/3642~~gnl/Chilomastix_cuspidata/3642.p2  ORF type:complete len:180 (-),score=51.29 gnl/Chilomastix_cuspidata/3642:21-560(-)